MTLDKWTREQLDYFAQFGNKVVNAYYEQNLDDDARPRVSDDYQMEQFIRAKYEKKRWAGKGSGPKPVSSSNESPPPPVKADRVQAPPPAAAPIIRSQQAPAPHQNQSSQLMSAESLLFAPNVSPAPAPSAQVPAYVSATQALAQQQQQQHPSLSKVCSVFLSFVDCFYVLF